MNRTCEHCKTENEYLPTLTGYDDCTDCGKKIIVGMTKEGHKRIKHNKQKRFYFNNRLLTGDDLPVDFEITSKSKVYYRDENGSLRRADCLMTKYALMIAYEDLTIKVTKWDDQENKFIYTVKKDGKEV